MPDETKCPACGVMMQFATPEYDECWCTDKACRMWEIVISPLVLAELHKALRTLPDGTELEPGEYQMQRLDFGWWSPFATFTIPAPTKPEPPVPEATLAIIRAAYPSAVCIVWDPYETGILSDPGRWVARYSVPTWRNGWLSPADGNRSCVCLDPALIPPWEGEGEPPVVSLREGGVMAPRNYVHKKYHEQVVAELRAQLEAATKWLEDATTWRPIALLPEKSKPGAVILVTGPDGSHAYESPEDGSGDGWFDNEGRELQRHFYTKYTLLTLPPAPKEEE